MKNQSVSGASSHPTRALTIQSTTARVSGLGVKKNLPTLVAGLFAVALVAGCASTKVSNRQSNIGASEKLPKPSHILVYDFTATPTDLPADSMFAASAPATVPSDEQSTLARQLGVQISAELVNAIREMGLPAVQVSGAATPQLNDIVIRGYLVSVDKGSAAKRMTLGFGSGGSELSTAVEGYQMTANGLRKLGAGTTDAKSGKGPGATLGAASWLVTGSPVGLIVGGGMKVYGEASGKATVEGRAKQTAKEIADVLKQRFIEQGWISQ